MEISDYKNLIQIINSSPQHFDQYQKSTKDFQKERLELLTEGDLTFRKKLRELKNEQLILKKKLLVLGFKAEDIIQGEQTKQGDKTKLQKREKIKKEILKQQIKIQHLQESIQKFQVQTKPPFSNQKINNKKIDQKPLYILNSSLDKNQEAQQLFKLLLLLQSQINDSEKELIILQKCIEKHKQQNLENKTIINLEDENECEKYQKKNENIKQIIEHLQQENQEKENQINEFFEEIRQEEKKKNDLNKQVEKLENLNVDGLEQEIKIIEKRISNLEQNLKDLTNQNQFNQTDFLKNKDQIKIIEEEIIKNKKENQLNNEEIKNLENQKQFLLEVLSKLKNKSHQLELILEQKKLCLENDIKFQIKSKPENLKNNFKENEKPTKKKFEENEKIFLDDLAENFTQNELQILGLKSDPKNKGWYFYNQEINSKIETEENLFQEITRAKYKRKQIIYELDHFDIFKKTEFLTDKTLSKNEEKLQKQQLIAKQLQNNIQEQKEVIKYKIEQGIHVGQKKNEDLNNSIFSQENFDDNIQEVNIKNQLQIYLGKFEIFSQFLSISKFQNPKIVASIQMKNFETNFSNVIGEMKGDFKAQFEFPIEINTSFINFCMNGQIILELALNSDNQEVMIFKSEIYLKELLEKNRKLGNISQFWNNKQILQFNQIDSIGFVEVFIRFKYSPALTIALVESNLTDLQNLQFDIENNEQKIQLQENQPIQEIKEKPNNLKSFLLKIDHIQGQLNYPQIFIYYEIEDCQYTTNSLKQTQFQLGINYTCSHYVNLDITKQIEFLLFDDSKDLNQNQQDLIGKCTLSLQHLVENKSVEEYCEVEMENQNQNSLKIKFLLLCY